MRLLASADLHGFPEVYEWFVDVAVNERPDGVVPFTRGSHLMLNTCGTFDVHQAERSVGTAPVLT